MGRCPNCNGLLIYEAEPWSQWARIKCSKCGWSRDDPNFGNEKPSFFPTDSVDRRIEWQQEHPGFDLYEPKKRGMPARNQREVSELLRQTRPVSAGDHRAWGHRLPHSGVAEMVG